MVQKHEYRNDNEISDAEVQSRNRWRNALVGSVVVGTLVIIGSHVYKREQSQDTIPTPDNGKVTISQYDSENF